MEELISITEARGLMPTYIDRANILEKNIIRANTLIKNAAFKNKNTVFLFVDVTEADDLISALVDKGYKCSKEWHSVNAADPLFERYKLTIMW